jgi:hypothetical protein
MLMPTDDVCSYRIITALHNIMLPLSGAITLLLLCCCCCCRTVQVLPPALPLLLMLPLHLSTRTQQLLCGLFVAAFAAIALLLLAAAPAAAAAGASCLGS